MTQQKSSFYFDYNATTPPDEAAKAALQEALLAWGNPSSIHWASRAPKLFLREARQQLAKAFGVSPLELIFTSGGSEANSTVIKSVFQTAKQNSSSERMEYITSQVEHPSVAKTFSYLETQGAVVHRLAVNREGFIDLDHYKKVLSEKTALVSVMMANNETGNIFPIQEMAQLAHAQGAVFHSDCVQALGKLPLNLSELEVDYATFSAHKFYALKGCGLLFAKKGKTLQPLIWGGGQERSRRGGTENVLGIHAFGKMTSQLNQVTAQSHRLTQLRDYFEDRVQKEISNVQITGKSAPRLGNTSSLVIADVDGETLLMGLDLKGMAVSTGAACSSGNPEPSSALLAMGLSRQEAQSSLRVSFGWPTTQEEVEILIETLKEVVARLRTISSTQVGGMHVQL
jgi:cysteine desulfurase